MVDSALVGGVIGVLALTVLFWVATTIPQPTSLQYMVLRLGMSLAAGATAGLISGFLTVSTDANARLIIQAGGGLALFVIVYFANPVRLAAPVARDGDLLAEDEKLPNAIEIGTKVVLDISHGQNKWNNFVAWAENSENPKIHISNQPYNDRPGVLIFALPFHQLLKGEEVELLKTWVENGGGLLIMGYYVETHHQTRISDLTRQWGITFNDDLLLPAASTKDDTRNHVYGSDGIQEKYGVRIALDSQSSHPVLKNIYTVVVVSGASINTEYVSTKPDLIVMSPPDTEQWEPHGPPDADTGMRQFITEYRSIGSDSLPVLVTFKSGLGKVAICATWKLATLPYGDNEQLMSNLIEWLRPKV